MVEVTEQLNLAQSAQAEHGVVKGGDLLDRNLLRGRLVYGGTSKLSHMLTTFPSAEMP